KVKEQVLNVL
ncbi:MAG: hypothetical protein KDC00_02655, partial [Flavobacteriales bacterium]|nr:hypothetical protein [Flavobacteriales bacterium]